MGDFQGLGGSEAPPMPPPPSPVDEEHDMRMALCGMKRGWHESLRSSMLKLSAVCSSSAEENGGNDVLDWLGSAEDTAAASGLPWVTSSITPHPAKRSRSGSLAKRLSSMNIGKRKGWGGDAVGIGEGEGGTLNEGEGVERGEAGVPVEKIQRRASRNGWPPQCPVRPEAWVSGGPVQGGNMPNRFEYDERKRVLAQWTDGMLRQTVEKAMLRQEALIDGDIELDDDDDDEESMALEEANNTNDFLFSPKPTATRCIEQSKREGMGQRDDKSRAWSIIPYEPPLVVQLSSSVPSPGLFPLPGIGPELSPTENFVPAGIQSPDWLRPIPSGKLGHAAQALAIIPYQENTNVTTQTADPPQGGSQEPSTTEMDVT